LLSSTNTCGFLAGFGVLTGGRVRSIRALSSWRPASAENGEGATLSTNPARMGLAGHNDRCINGSAAGSRKKRPAGVLYGREPSWPGLRCVRPHGPAEHAPSAPQPAQCRIRPSRDVLYRNTPSRMSHGGVRGILAAMVWYSAVLYGGWPHNYKFGVSFPNHVSKAACRERLV
jgi:hypothetical protein